jgi:hypothetical protein
MPAARSSKRVAPSIEADCRSRRSISWSLDPST